MQRGAVSTRESRALISENRGSDRADATNLYIYRVSLDAWKGRLNSWTVNEKGVRWVVTSIRAFLSADALRVDSKLLLPWMKWNVAHCGPSGVGKDCCLNVFFHFSLHVGSGSRDWNLHELQLWILKSLMLWLTRYTDYSVPNTNI